MADARARQISARNGVVHMIFGQHHAGDRHLAAANVRMGIDAACHDHLAVKRVLVRDLGIRIWRDDAAILDEDIADFAVDPVRGVVDCAAGELDEHSRSRNLA